MEHSSTFFPLLLITFLAVIVPLLVSRIKIVRIPTVVGEISAGIVIGQSGLDVVQFTPTLNFLSEFGFAFLMFLSGLEVNLDVLSASDVRTSSARWRRPVPLALLYFAATVALASAFGYGLTWLQLSGSPVLMALILSTTSLGIVVPILKERELSASPYGQAVLVAALVSDFVTLVLLSIVIAVLSRGFNVELLLFMVLIVAFFVAVRISKRLSRIKGLGRLVSELSHATSQIRVRGAFTLLVMFVALAESLGVELILGAFLAGVLVSISGRGKESPLHGKLDAIGYGFFIPIFFIAVGARFDLAALTTSRAALLLVPLLMVIAYVVKLAPAVIYRTIFSWRESFALGTLLSSRLSLIIAASAIALGLGLISTATNSAVVLVAIVTCTVSPLLFSWVLPPRPKLDRSGIIIFGTHQLALLLAQRLRGTGERITFMSRFRDRLEHLPDDGYEAVLWDPDNVDLAKNAGLDTARAFIAVTNSSEVLVEVCGVAKQRYGIPTVIARADQPDIASELQGLGVGVVQSTTAVALALESALLYPAAYDILLDKQDGIELADVVLRRTDLDRKLLREIRLPGDALIVGVRRTGETIVPHGDTVVRTGDTLILIGAADSLHDASAMFGRNGDRGD